MSYYKQQGVPADMLVVGFPAYGHSYTLASADSNGIGDPVTGAGNAGPYTQAPGTLGYNEARINVLLFLFFFLKKGVL